MPKSCTGFSTMTFPSAVPRAGSASAAIISPTRRQPAGRITTELARPRRTEQRGRSQPGRDLLARQLDQPHAANLLDGDEADLAAARLLVPPHRERQGGLREIGRHRGRQPARSSRARMRSTAAPSQTPSACDTRAAATMPIATASPCRKRRYSVSTSTACPTVCPKLSVARTPRSARARRARRRRLLTRARRDDSHEPLGIAPQDGVRIALERGEQRRRRR